MRGPINVKSPNNITNWQMRFNSAFKGLIYIKWLKIANKKLEITDVLIENGKDNSNCHQKFYLTFN
jgi:hypothetical protein